MNETTRRILIRLREQPGSLSRNRHFATYEEPAGRQALLLNRFLGSLERDILARGGREPVEVRRIQLGQRPRIQLTFPRLHGSRTSFLSRDEFELLLKNPEVRRVLAPLLIEETA